MTVRRLGAGMMQYGKVTRGTSKGAIKSTGRTGRRSGYEDVDIQSKRSFEAQWGQGCVRRRRGERGEAMAIKQSPIMGNGEATRCMEKRGREARWRYSRQYETRRSIVPAEQTERADPGREDKARAERGAARKPLRSDEWSQGDAISRCHIWQQSEAR
ncbi:hypothetical protein B0H10DRAFT_1960602 [Mycena sp. CBHHK59/15]|nr:hypothetical protein B0H10DRAFT_1960602 [Mycena sp. CBHHK59/15]